MVRWILTLLFLGSLFEKTPSKGYFLAAVEGFSHHGLTRPWEHSNKENSKRLDNTQKKHGHLVIRFYVNEKVDDSIEEEGGVSGNLNTTTVKNEAEDSSMGKKEIPRSSTSVSMTESSFATPVSKDVSPEPTVRSCLPDLIAMTRPYNNPVVVLFHMLGIYLAPQSTLSFWKVLFTPSMMVTLVALLLTSSTSMLVNDYYDFKLGHDSMKPFQPLNTPSRLPLKIAKRFLSYLYAGALLCVTMVPGVPARMTVVMGLMLTFWYTQHLKPRTWLKNVVCASLIALSPLTSGIAAMSVTGTSGGWESLFRVVAILFVGILGREITMDISDMADDGLHGVRTVPVVYGTKFASTVGLVCSGAVTSLAIAGPLGDILNGRWNGIILRRSILAAVGGLAQLRHGWRVFQTEGQDDDIVNKAINEGIFTVVLLLASFV